MERRGFTLLEVLMATAILGIILTTVYGVVARTLTAKNHAEGRADLYAAARESVLKMADELETALPPPPLGGGGLAGVPGNGRVPNDAVQFMSVIRRQFSASTTAGGRSLIAYFLEPMEHTPSLFYLVREEKLQSLPLPDTGTESDSGAMAEEAAAAEATDSGAGSGTETAEPEVDPAAPRYQFLLDRVAGLELRYYNAETGAFDDAWDTTDVVDPTGKLPTLPGAIKIALYVADEDGNVHDFSTVIDLPLANLQPTPTS